MKAKSPRSIKLYEMLLDRGYPEPFCDLVTKNLNTDFTANRMIGYLSHYKHLPEGEIVIKPQYSENRLNLLRIYTIIKIDGRRSTSYV